MRHLAPSLLVITFLASACSPDPASLGQRQDPITDGVVTSGHPSVGRLSLDGHDGLSYACTGTLVGARTVLSAAHCIEDIAKATFNVGGQTYAVAQMIPHPAYTSQPTRNDVAILRLTQAPSVQPTAVSTKTPWVGLGLTLIGYGITRDGADDSGTKRKAQNVIADVKPERFNMRGTGGSVGNICSGDSGGPAFALIDGIEVQVGVHSYGEGDCGVSEWDARVDPFVSWMQQVSGGDVTLPQAPDTAKPQVAFASPRNQQSLAAGALVVEIAAQDDRGVTSVSLLLDGAAVATRTQAPYRFDVSLTGGVHTLEARASDAAGNVGSVSIAVQATGTTPPPPVPGQVSVQILSPTMGAQVPMQATIQTAVAGEINNVVLLVDGSVIELKRSGPFDFTTALAPGPHELTVVAEARDGKRVYQSVRVVADPHAPPPSSTEELRSLVGGCQLGSSDAPLASLLPLLLLGLLVVRQRRNRP